MIDERILKNEERAVYALRSLYRGFGYTPYKMSKFEEYDLYVRNKDFLISDGIITFTDTAGKLLALKPDVTLSIVKNSKDTPSGVEKLYYNENVYRIAKGSRNYKEIMQTGLECIGSIGLYDVCEVLILAVKSLALLDGDWALDISHAALASSLLDKISLSKEVRDRVFEAISQKNADTVDALLRLGDITEEGAYLAKLLINEYADVSCLKTVLAPYTDTAEAEGALTELSDIFTALSALGYGGRININFSLIGNRSYYSGVVFKGYIKGIPDSVLSGGRYDGLMKKMGKHTGAIGFAVYLDSFERFKNEKREYDVDVLLLRSNDAPLESVILAAEGLSAEGLTVSVQDTVPEGLRYCKIMKISKEGLEKENGNA